MTSVDSGKQIKVNGGQKKLRMQYAPSGASGRASVKNAYLVEFASDSSAKDYYRTVTRSLRRSHGIDESQVTLRRFIRSSLFSGISVTVNNDHAIDALEMIEDAIAIYPVYTVQAPKPIRNKNGFRFGAANNKNDVYTMNSHVWTGVASVHQEFNNYGKGVRVRTVEIERFILSCCS